MCTSVSVLLTYHMHMRCVPRWVGHSHSRVEYMIKCKSQFKKRSTANNVVIKIPVPVDADSPKFKVAPHTHAHMPIPPATVYAFEGVRAVCVHVHTLSTVPCGASRTELHVCTRCVSVGSCDIVHYRMGVFTHCWLAVWVLLANAVCDVRRNSVHSLSVRVYVH